MITMQNILKNDKFNRNFDLKEKNIFTKFMQRNNIYIIDYQDMYYPLMVSDIIVNNIMIFYNNIHLKNESQCIITWNSEYEFYFSCWVNDTNVAISLKAPWKVISERAK